MKKLILLNLLSILTSVVFAQSNSDSLAYQLQREKINTMLEQRAEKFGLYDESLKQHTGIFGVQTKSDIRHSNDILTDIIKNDDSIYQQIKTLLDFRAFQQTQIQSHSHEAEKRRLGYLNTIGKLRTQVYQLKANAAKQHLEDIKTTRLLVIITLLAVIATVLLFIQKKRQIA
jgi:hypothetical protein